ncbi:MAG: branched-chain amino acid ABC transporter permease [Actinobacteria bacterium]|nr:branched-chain amino acid ABC transporter permease [Actinomycetota bacterium]
MRRRASGLLEATSPGFVAFALVLAVSCAALAGSAATQRAATQMLVMAVIVIGIYTFVGNSGMISFGHIAFVGVGAYATALMTIPGGLKLALLPALPSWLQTLELSLPLALLASGLLAALLGAVISVLVLRLDGMAFSIASLAWLVSVNVVISNWSAVTRGTQTMVGIPADLTIGSALPWVAVAIAVALAFQLSRPGFRLRSTREDDVAASSLGVRVRRERAVGLVVSAFLCGIGGGLYAHFLGALSPTDVYLPLTVLALMMLIVGGIRSLGGAVVGTVVISVLAELLRRVESGVDLGFVSLAPRPGIEQVLLALVLLVILLLRPSGITGGRELSWDRVRKLPATAGALARPWSIRRKEYR